MGLSMSHLERALFVLVVLSTAGCEGCSSPPEGRSAEPGRAEEASGAEATAEPEAVAGDPGPPPVVRIAGDVDRFDRSVALRVENRGTEQASLASRLTLQRRDGDAWEDVAATVELRDSCREPAPSCVTLAPGAVYLPPDWRGELGDAQCDCERCADAPAGTYRFVAASCSGAHRVEGEPIALP